jgi:hypothetical protein
MFIFIRSNGAPAITILALAVLISCGTKDAEHTAPPATWAPGISQNLTRSGATTQCVIDNIGQVGNPAVERLVQVPGATTFGITGWAIDEPNKTTAGGVDVVIDQAPYNAHYGSPRPDVATHFKQPNYANSCFELMVAPGQLAKGPHSVSIRIISSDKKSYYQGPVVPFAVN